MSHPSDPPTITGTVSIDHRLADASLFITVWDHGRDSRDPVLARISIPVENLPDFLRDVTTHVTYALSTAARRLEVGDCATCRNRGIVDTVKNGHPWTVSCPDCRDRWPTQPFANAPQITPRPTS